jgi:murein DD-endopeptidase MepM/ murein hydrolase activator NlpD
LIAATTRVEGLAASQPIGGPLGYTSQTVSDLTVSQAFFSLDVRSERPGTIFDDIQALPKAEVQPTAHIVQQGESVASIASDYGILQGSIRIANPSIPVNQVIYPGASLVIPPVDASNEELSALKARDTQVLQRLQRTRSTTVSVRSSAPAPISEVREFRLMLPTQYRTISQPYSVRHGGIDYAVDMGTAVVSAAAGCITKATTGWNGGYGTMIIIEHANGMATLYAHLRSLQVSVGQCLDAGQQIALSGNSGRSTGPHVHFELRRNGSPISPNGYLSY